MVYCPATGRDCSRCEADVCEKQRTGEHITLRDSPQALDSVPPDSYRDRFTSEERITSSLRLQSVAPVYRAMIGILALIPPFWRGIVVSIVCFIFGFLAYKSAPELVSWIRSK